MCLIACTANIHKECAAQPESWSVIEWCLEWYTCPAECVTLTRQSCCQDAMMFQRIFCLQCTCLYFALGLVAKHVATLCQLLALGNMCIAREWCHNRNYQRDIPWTKKTCSCDDQPLNCRYAEGTPKLFFSPPYPENPTPPKIKSIWFAPVPGQNQHDKDLLRHHAHLISMGANSPASCRALGWHGSVRTKPLNLMD